jgi:hypothetical protein
MRTARRFADKAVSLIDASSRSGYRCEAIAAETQNTAQVEEPTEVEAA